MAYILLFNPPAPGGGGFTREGRCTQEAGVWATQWPPLSLTTAAALLVRDGHTVKVVDFPALGMKTTDIPLLIEKNRSDFAIWGTATPTLYSDLLVAGLIKGISPTTVTAVMGTHVTARPEEALSENAVDIVIRGEPEGIIGNLCRAGRSRWENVKGISYRKKQLIQHNPDADYLEPATIPAPAWRLVDHCSYRLPLKGRPFLMVAPVRGCPYRCTFCTAPLYYGTKLRRRPIENVLREIETNIKTYSINEIFIWADTFTADREYVREFCRAVIARRLRISWTCNSRVDTIDEETLALMKNAGLWMISFGLESGNDSILARSGKKMTVAQSRKAVLWAKEAGIRVAGHFIFGLPGESKGTMAETLALALELPLDIAQFYTAAPFPGTGLHAEAEREGWLRKDSSSSQASAVMDLPGLPAAEVDDFRRFAFRKFYGRPQAALNVLSMAEWRALKSVPAAMKGFLGWTR